MEENTGSKRWRMKEVALCVVIALLAWERYKNEAAIKDTFFYDCHVTVTDAESGEPLEPTGIAWKAAELGRDLFPQSVTTTSHGDRSVTLRGIASVPRRFIFSKAGYL